MKYTYEISITYDGLYYLEAENAEQAIEEAQFRFSDEIGSYEMAKMANYRITHVGNAVQL